MATVLGLVHLRLNVVQAMSLKDKRRVIASFKGKLISRCNVSVAEVDAQDRHRLAVLAVAMVGSDRTYVESALQKIVNQAATHRDMILIDYELEWL